MEVRQTSRGWVKMFSAVLGLSIAGLTLPTLAHPTWTTAYEARGLQEGIRVAAVTPSLVRAQQLASLLGGQGALPENVRLRFQILAHEMPNLPDKNRRGGLFSFFQTTRTLAWAQSLAAPIASDLRELEQQMVALAQLQGLTLSLPAVGASSSKPSTVGQPEATPSQLLGPPLSQAALVELNRAAERAVQKELARRYSDELNAVAGSLRALAVDLERPGVSASVVRSVLGSRARYRVSSEAKLAQTETTKRLGSLIQGVQATFPPQVLRQASGKRLTF